MSWFQVVKVGERIIYTGTCPKCNRYFDKEDKNKFCPKNLPAPAQSHIQGMDTCPMKEMRK